MTFHFHGTPITPRRVFNTLAGKLFCVSFANPQDIKAAHEIGQSVMLDNGAFTFWKRSGNPAPDHWKKYYLWCEQWLEYQTTWAVIPDIIDGSEEDNDRLIGEWPFSFRGAPVWHLNESIDRLCALCSSWPKICFGSSGEYSQVRTKKWHKRVTEAFNAICDENGNPKTRVHMLRGMALAEGPYPFYSLDSTDIARNHALKSKNALLMADRWDQKQCPPQWYGSLFE